MKPLPRTPAVLLLAVAACLTALLAACGPGVGGSGTGLESGAPPGTAVLPTPSLHADGADGRQVQAVLEGSRLRVDAACPRLRFEGTWDGVSAGPLRFDGRLDATRSATAEALVSGTTLTLTLRDGTGAVLLGPLPLAAVPALPPLAGC
jgi:hypothetical protein